MRVKMCVCKHDLCDTGTVLYQYHCPLLAFCQDRRPLHRYCEGENIKVFKNRRSGEDWELLDRLMKANIS